MYCSHCEELHHFDATQHCNAALHDLTVKDIPIHKMLLFHRESTTKMCIHDMNY